MDFETGVVYTKQREHKSYFCTGSVRWLALQPAQQFEPWQEVKISGYKHLQIIRWTYNKEFVVYLSFETFGTSMYLLAMMCSLLQLDQSHIIIVPGEHDYNRPIDLANFHVLWVVSAGCTCVVKSKKGCFHKSTTAVCVDEFVPYVTEDVILNLVYKK